MRHRVLVSLLCGAALLAPRAAFCQGEPAPVDLAQIDVRVAEGRVVDSVKLEASELKPEKDGKLVVVTLRATLKGPGRLLLPATMFSALYSWTVSATPPQEKVGKTVAKAVQIGDGTWGASADHTYAAPRDATIDVAFSVPNEVQQFYILWDTAKGKGRAAVKLQGQK